jgi:hypothetical protein
MQIATKLGFLGLGLALAAGCGGGSGGGGGGAAGRDGGSAGSGGSAGTGGSPGTGGSGGTSSGACPAAPPANGQPCTLDSASSQITAHCTWGDDPRPTCRTLAVCDQGKWSVTTPSHCSEPPLPAACPAAPPAPGSDCPDPALGCWYDDGKRCWCSECMGGSPYPNCQFIDPPQWACAQPPAGCPNPLPQAGEACSTPGLSCGPNCELQIVCEGSAWQWRRGECPICAAPDTPVATPSGERRIAELRAGDLVYSIEDSAIVAAPILRTGSTPVRGHRVLRVVLESGAVLELSPGHPTADGRRFDQLAPGSMLGETQRVRSVELIDYAHARTYDILPASSSGIYFAAGAPIGSTLRR